VYADDIDDINTEPKYICPACDVEPDQILVSKTLAAGV